MKLLEAVRVRIGEGLIHLGTRVLGLDFATLEGFEKRFSNPEDDEEEDHDVALAQPVVITELAQEMIRQGRPMPPPAPSPPRPPPTGSIAARMLAANRSRR